MIKKVFLFVFIFSAIVLLALFYVWERATAFQLTLVLAEKKRNLETIQNSVDSLRLEYLDISSVIRIEGIAKEKLGMRYPKSGEVRYVIME